MTPSCSAGWVSRASRRTRAEHIARGEAAQPSDEAALLVRVQPRASRNELAGERDGRLVVRVTAPPADGRANVAMRRLIAKRAGVPQSRVEIIRGRASRDKLVRIGGLDTRTLRSRLGLG